MQCIYFFSLQVCFASFEGQAKDSRHSPVAVPGHGGQDSHPQTGDVQNIASIPTTVGMLSFRECAFVFTIISSILMCKYVL